MTSRRLLEVVVCALAGTVVLWSAPAAAAEGCFSAEALAAVQCEPGDRAAVAGKRDHVFRAPRADAPQKPRPVSHHAPPRRIERGSQRDARRKRHGPTVTMLLMKEISEVSRLLAATPVAHPDHPKLLRRLADDYAELASSAAHERVDAEIEAQRATRLKKRDLAARQKERAEREGKRERTARKLAVRQLEALIEEHPSYCNLPDQRDPADRACADEALYYLAYEHEQQGQLDDARGAYLALVTDHKQSKYLASAYVAFGELFFQRAQGDPSQWGLARQAYEEALRIAPAKNRLWGYAAYKLGYVHWNQGDEAAALAAFERTIRFAQEDPASPGASGLVDAARRDLVAVYALAGDASRAFASFQPLSGDGAGESTKTHAMLEDLGTALLDSGHYRGAITVYRDLLARNDGARSCDYRGGITRATMALHSGRKQPVLEALEEQLAGYERLAASDPGRPACANAIAALVTETAMAWHLEAVGSGDVRGTLSPETMAAAERLYDLATQRFSAADFARFTFPRLVKEDWPSYARVLYARADLLFSQKNWERCGSAFEAAYEADPQAPDARESLFAAAICWKNRFDQRGPATRTRNARRDLSEEEQGMVRALGHYACRIEPAPGDRAGLDDLVEAKLARGRTYFEAGQFEEAALVFRDVALAHGSVDAAVDATNMYLDALDAAAAKRRDTCKDVLTADVLVLQAQQCEGRSGDASRTALCHHLGHLARNLEKEAIDRMLREAAQSPQPLERYRQAGEGYLDLWNKRGRAACLAKEPTCTGNEELLFNAAVAFQSANLLGNAIRARETLLDPRFGLHETDAAKRASLGLARNYQAIAAYESAAKWYEHHATLSPDASEAPVALKDAVVLRLGLGQDDQALAAARQFRRVYGEKRPGEAAHIAFAIGAHHADRGEWRTAETRLRDAMPDIERHASPDLQLEALAVLGRALAAQEKRAEADRVYGRVRDAAIDLPALRTKIDPAGGDEAEKRRRWRRVLTSVGEALVHFANGERDAASALAFPRYRGDRSLADVQRFMQSDVKSWLERKRGALERAEQAYRTVIELGGGDPAPRWAIAASAAMGELWATLVDDIGRAPYPKEWDQPGFIPNAQPPTLWHELRAAYQAELAVAVAPFRARAKDTYEHCLENGILFQHFDDELARCEQWLVREYPGEYHGVEELAAPPSRLRPPGTEPALPATANER